MDYYKLLLLVRYYYFDHPLKIDANIDQLNIIKLLSLVYIIVIVETTLLLYIHAIKNHLHIPCVISKRQIQCKCLDEDDPRAETTCPVTEECISGILDPTIRGCFCIANYKSDSCTCTSAIHPDNQQGCVYDENEDATFNRDDCRQTKTCTGNNTPIGCSCAYNGRIQTGECKCSQLHLPDGCTSVK
ncbi:MAG: hypothetical protein EZS28_009481 [Streblomastix strix]|uniref:Uncharacterized protein n=1 Tax=Streblomastix strix TaxID=222440 RepID=A0A5J4WKC7_9EUKA|nr:MAG: hypothetical protein EZS28_009481 [Streblomastix strix]